jgi:hypothetical protein
MSSRIYVISNVLPIIMFLLRTLPRVPDTLTVTPDVPMTTPDIAMMTPDVR